MNDENKNTIDALKKQSLLRFSFKDKELKTLSNDEIQDNKLKSFNLYRNTLSINPQSGNNQSIFFTNADYNSNLNTLQNNDIYNPNFVSDFGGNLTNVYGSINKNEYLSTINRPNQTETNYFSNMSVLNNMYNNKISNSCDSNNKNVNKKEAYFIQDTEYDNRMNKSILINPVNTQDINTLNKNSYSDKNLDNNNLPTLGNLNKQTLTTVQTTINNNDDLECFLQIEKRLLKKERRKTKILTKNITDNNIETQEFNNKTRSKSLIRTKNDNKDKIANQQNEKVKELGNIEFMKTYSQDLETEINKILNENAELEDEIRKLEIIRFEQKYKKIKENPLEKLRKIIKLLEEKQSTFPQTICNKEDCKVILDEYKTIKKAYNKLLKHIVYKDKLENRKVI